MNILLEEKWNIKNWHLLYILTLILQWFKTEIRIFLNLLFLYIHFYVLESTEKCHLGGRSYFSSSAQHVVNVLIWNFVKWEVTDDIVAVLWSAFSQICSGQHESSLHNFFHFFFSKYFIKFYEMQPFCCSDTATDWKNICFILSERSDFYLIDNLSLIAHAVPLGILASFSVDEILLLSYVSWHTSHIKMKH